MKCPYCKKDVALKVWGKHSQVCEDRKRIRGENVPVVGSVETESYYVPGFDEMTKDDLVLYLETNDIEHNPKAKKSKLLKLAKGE